MNKGISIFLLIFSTYFVSAYPQQGSDTAYLRTINLRAAKIADGLEITDTSKNLRIRDIISAQYYKLRTVHDARNAKIKTAKKDSTLDKATRDTLIKKTEAEANATLAKLHIEYLSKLSRELTPEQIDKVKDGMTSGKVAFTYNGYLQMIPSLTDAQKKQILDWLVEAREIAMDAESSEKKTAVFGKYKGRIANYLSAQGYDLKKEGEEWNKRIKAKEGEKK